MVVITKKYKLVNLIFVVTINMKLVTWNYVCSHDADLRENKNKPSVFKKEYSEEVMASTKSKRERK